MLPRSRWNTECPHLYRDLSFVYSQELNEPKSITLFFSECVHCWRPSCVHKYIAKILVNLSSWRRKIRHIQVTFNALTIEGWMHTNFHLWVWLWVGHCKSGRRCFLISWAATSAYIWMQHKSKTRKWGQANLHIVKGAEQQKWYIIEIGMWIPSSLCIRLCLCFFLWRCQAASGDNIVIALAISNHRNICFSIFTWVFVPWMVVWCLLRFGHKDMEVEGVCFHALCLMKSEQGLFLHSRCTWNQLF